MGYHFLIHDPVRFGFIRRFDPGFERLRQAVQSGGLDGRRAMEVVLGTYAFPERAGKGYEK